MAYRYRNESSSSDDNDTFSRSRRILRSDSYSLPPTPAPQQQPTTSIPRMNTPLALEDSPTFSGLRQAVITPLEPGLELCAQEPDDDVFQEPVDYGTIDLRTKGKKKFQFGRHKRQFPGNRFTSSKRSFSPTYEREGVISPIPVNFPKSEFDRFKQQSKPIPPPPPGSISGTSKATVEKQYKETVAHRKLMYTPEYFEPCDTPLRMQTYDNMIVNLQTLLTMLDDLTVCKSCKKGSMRMFQSKQRAGSATYLQLECSACSTQQGFWSVGAKSQAKIQVGDQQIRKRNELLYGSILGGRLIGVGLSKLELYHSTLSIPIPCSRHTYVEAERELIVAAEYIAEKSMKRAVNELKSHAECQFDGKYVHAIASYDGSYQQRSGKSGGGFSRYCFAAAISANTGKVLSYGIASNSCKLCNEYENLLMTGQITKKDLSTWNASHSKVCTAKYQDYASVQLESALAPSVVQDALDRGVIFSGLVTDGDTKTHHKLHSAGLYQHLGIHEIERIECLAHVCKRIKINIIRKQEKALKLNRDQKNLQKQLLTQGGGMSEAEALKQVSPAFRGTLQKDSRKRGTWEGPTKAIRTVNDTVAGQVASYYRIAIHRNRGNIREIIRAIDAIPLHLSANDGNAKDNHRFCPITSNTWCRYQEAIFNRRTPPHHPNYLSEGACKIITDVFQEFGYNAPEFIRKVQEGRTSNHNEAIHSVLWRMVHKDEYASYEMMQLGSALAIIRYNDGFRGIETLFQLLEIPISPQIRNHFEKLDLRRVKASYQIQARQQSRFAKRQHRYSKVARQIRKHGAGYSSGAYSTDQKFHSSSSEEDIAQPQSAPIAICQICQGTEENCIVGIGIGLKVKSTQINWIQCDKCDQWSHMECVGIAENEIEEDTDWYCTDCVDSFETFV